MEIDLSVLEAVSTHYGPTSVRIGQFFVAYNSVISLAYESFSRTLLNVKAHVASAMQGSLKPENPGSKWPKTSLACLVTNTSLTEPQVHDLRNACVDFTTQMRKLSDDDARVSIGKLDVVVFGCRSLERRLLSIAVRLNGAVALDDTPPEAHVEAVRRTMAGFDQAQHAKYYPGLTPNGRTLCEWYRQDHVEATLVTDVSLSEKAQELVQQFQDEINRRLPGSYGWFDPASWHLTVRALVPK